MRTLLFSFFLLAFFQNSLCTGQESAYEYVGVIKLNDSAFIPYRLAFSEKDGIITGYSLSDMGGAHETKSNITGRYSQKDKSIQFKEIDIVYTKSPIDELDMCLVNFEGKLKNLSKNKPFSGNFKGIYPDGGSCLDGMIIVSSKIKAEQRMEKLSRRIEKSKRITQEVKDKVNLKRTIDTITMSTVRANENLNIFTKSNTLSLIIYDSGKVDNDRIQLKINDVIVLEDFSIQKEPKEIQIQLTDGKGIIEVTALDEGTSAPNTVKVELKDGTNFIATRTSLKTKESATLTLLRQ